MNVYALSKLELAEKGQDLSSALLDKNGLDVPEITFRSMRSLIAGKPKGSYGCGVYLPSRRAVIVSTEDCARPSPGLPMKWSFPGYTTDRTPMGVVAHEIGHYVDHMLGYPSLRVEWTAVGKEVVTSYEPNSSEKFAESFRVFILNPALLKIVSPGRFTFLREVLGIRPIFQVKDPIRILESRGATPKIIAAANSKIQAASKRNS